MGTSIGKLVENLPSSLFCPYVCNVYTFFSSFMTDYWFIVEPYCTYLNNLK